jgi:hypothetical protein
MKAFQFRRSPDAPRPSLRERTASLRQSAAAVFSRSAPKVSDTALGDVPDPIFALIERHRATWQAYGEASTATDRIAIARLGGDTSPEALAPMVAAAEVAHDAEVDALRDVINARPSTPAGLLAMIRHIGEHQDLALGIDSLPDVFGALVEAVAGVLGRSVEAVPDPIFAAIERNREGMRLRDEALAAIEAGEIIGEDGRRLLPRHLQQAWDAAGDESWRRYREEVLRTRPTTEAGRQALAAHVLEWLRAQEGSEPYAESDEGDMLRALKLIAGQEPASDC